MALRLGETKLDISLGKKRTYTGLKHKSKESLGVQLSGTVPAWQAWGPEFDSRYQRGGGKEKGVCE